MGIKNFHKFLRKHFPEIYEEVPLSMFKDKRIAIDISIYLFKYKSIHKEKWIGVFFSLLLILKKYKMQCVCIYDSKAPIEKDAKKQERKQKKKNAEDRIHDIQEQLAIYHRSGEISPLLSQISHKKGTLRKILNPSDAFIDMEAIQKELLTLSNQIVNITKYDIMISKQLLEIIGIPYYDAEGEAESLCAYLCCHQQVDAVLSDDTDVIVYGTPLFITKLNMRNETCIVLNPDKITERLNLSVEQFVDLCIMSGTDYNDNIPNIGNEKAYAMLLKYHNLETIEHEKKELPVDVLNFRRIREIFSVPETLNQYQIRNGSTDIQQLNQFTQQHRIPINLTRIQSLMET